MELNGVLGFDGEQCRIKSVANFLKPFQSRYKGFELRAPRAKFTQTSVSHPEKSFFFIRAHPSGMDSFRVLGIVKCSPMMIRVCKMREIVKISSRANPPLCFPVKETCSRGERPIFYTDFRSFILLQSDPYYRLPFLEGCK